jgi:hypothetical protein
MRSFFHLLLFLAGTSVFAQDEPGAYLGCGLGQFDYEEYAVGVTLDDTALAYKVYGGYRFDETWALEAAYGQTDDLK